MGKMEVVDGLWKEDLGCYISYITDGPVGEVFFQIDEEITNAQHDRCVVLDPNYQIGKRDMYLVEGMSCPQWVFTQYSIEKKGIQLGD
jgi:hypothetical protein